MIFLKGKITKKKRKGKRNGLASVDAVWSI
jgi:hypothetical protein